jgi:beta-glucosidase
MLRGLKELNITPMVTLHHFSDPLWLTEQGGWENEAVVGLFETYARRVVEALKDYASLWCTINEPNVYVTVGYLAGLFPPGKKDVPLGQKVMLNMARGHAAAYHAIHALQPEARAGLAINYRSIHPAHAWFPLDRAVAGFQRRSFNEFFPRVAQDGVARLPFGRKRLPEARGTQDFIGVNYYTRERVAFDLLKPGALFSRRSLRPGALLSDGGMIANEPEGMFEAVKWAQGFGLPILITENGVDDAEDRMRPQYLAQHLHQLWRAVNYNWPVKGYFHWSLVDNFEWERGWTQRFGLWGLDVETQKRIRRPSVDLYAEICKENGLSSEMVQKYCPEVADKLFPV